MTIRDKMRQALVKIRVLKPLEVWDSLAAHWNDRHVAWNGKRLP